MLLAICFGLVRSVPSPSAIAASGTPPIPPVQSITSLGVVAQNPLVLGRDGTYSALINGKSVWTFGDTSLSVENQSGKNFIDNSLSWADNLDASHGITLNHDHLDATGVPTEFIPYLPWEQHFNYIHDPKHCTASPCGAEYAMWPGSLVPDPARNRALLFYGEIYRVVGHASWTPVGTGIAVVMPDGTITRPIENPGSPYPTLMWSAKETGFGSGWTVVGDTLYSYGCVSGFLIMNCQVARVPLAGVLEKAQWSYYVGNNTWSAQAADAVTVFQGGAAGNSVFYDAYLGMYMAIYSGVFSNDVYYRVSYTPWGPWSNQTLLFTGLPGWNANPDYAGLAHPEFAQRNGQIQYVTYAHTTGFLHQNLPLTQVVFGKPGR
ncbi:MAG: DUF4185 domain-containing protein [Chloroflexota bacterium]|nr:DUF4185 domain-containing protein [Chloroflexota bacterium]